MISLIKWFILHVNNSYIKSLDFLLQHAHALELLKDQLGDGMKALDVGSGSGYLTACMAHMVGTNNRPTYNMIKFPLAFNLLMTQD